jgi:hypothetical protein
MAILTHASWNTFYSAALIGKSPIGLFPARGVLGSYLNLTIAAGVLTLVLVAGVGPAQRKSTTDGNRGYVFRSVRGVPSMTRFSAVLRATSTEPAHV